MATAEIPILGVLLSGVGLGLLVVGIAGTAAGTMSEGCGLVALVGILLIVGGLVVIVGLRTRRRSAPRA